MEEQVQDLSGKDALKSIWDAWETQDNNSFVYQVQSGRLGYNAGLANGLKKINRFIHGTQRGRYYLIGADSGVGKTSLTDFMFVLSTWAAAKAKGVKIKIYYCSFEVSRLDKLAKWVCFYIFLEFGKCIPSQFILGRIMGKYPTDEDMPMIMEAYAMVNEMLKDIHIIDSVVHPTKIFEDLIEHHYENWGTLTRAKVADSDAKKGKKGRVLTYVPHDPNALTMLVIDHLGLINSEMGLNLKGTMDKMSRYCIILRNLFQTTCVVIQQFSTDLLETKRKTLGQVTGTKKASAIIPTRLDFGDSKATYRDAEVVIGLVKPIDFDLDDFIGVNTSKVSAGGLGDYMIVMCLLKNRYGASNKLCGLFLNPIAGVCEDLPDGMDNDVREPFYKKAKELDSLSQLYEPKYD